MSENKVIKLVLKPESNPNKASAFCVNGAFKVVIRDKEIERELSIDKLIKLKK